RHQLAASGTVNEAVVLNAQQPSHRMRGDCQFSKVLARYEADILHQVLRVRAVPQQAIGDPEQSFQMRRDHRLELFLLQTRHEWMSCPSWPPERTGIGNVTGAGARDGEWSAGAGFPPVSELAAG